MQPRPRGKRLAIVTKAGGPGGLATDHLIMRGGELAEIAPATIEELNNILPPAWSHRNPLDVLGDADAKKYGAAIKAFLQDPGVDGLLIILTPQAMTNAADIAREVVAQAHLSNKPVLASWVGERDVAEGRDVLEAGHIPNYRIPENAVNTFMNMYSYTRNIEALYQTPKSIPDNFTPDHEANRKIVASIMAEGRTTMNEQEAKEFLRNYQIPVTGAVVAQTEAEAIEAAEKLGYPVVMKIASPDILHKTNIGGVKLNLANKSSVKNAFNLIMHSAQTAMPEARLDGVPVEPMLNKKYELIIRSKKDPIFGPVMPVMLAALTPEAPTHPATSADGPASEPLIDEPASGLPADEAQIDHSPTPKRRRPFDLRIELGKCKSHPSARLTVAYSPNEVPKVNGGRPLGAVGRCVERVLRQHPPRHAVTVNP